MVLVSQERKDVFSNSKLIWDDFFFVSLGLDYKDNFITHTHVYNQQVSRTRVAKNNYFTKFFNINTSISVLTSIIESIYLSSNIRLPPCVGAFLFIPMYNNIKRNIKN